MRTVESTPEKRWLALATFELWIVKSLTGMTVIWTMYDDDKGSSRHTKDLRSIGCIASPARIESKANLNTKPIFTLNEVELKIRYGVTS